MRRINVVGTSGSGKSTFSRQLALALNCPHIEMDRLYWKKNWQGTSDEELLKKLSDALSAEHWVLDGNYNRTRAVKWKDVDTIVWVDYSFLRTLFQATTRAFHRCVSGKEIWPNTNNVETFSRSLFSRDSILLWTLKTYHSNRQRYVEDMANEDYQHIRFIRLSSPRMAQEFLQQISESPDVKKPA
ncbi:AAA family ATPase [Vibrio hepatarius]|uniref:AAA family ATPase n=1 Tax=Vibrio hepatarius TaxID=171383 RepID=UPI00142D9A4D|nr:AAA family ATPase [Vibrio hepatarius]NIY84142.1 adenylate kinase [Vibrio hepatarius]